MLSEMRGACETIEREIEDSGDLTWDSCKDKTPSPGSPGEMAAALETHHVGPNLKTAQRPSWQTKPSQYLNIFHIYPHLLLCFSQRSMQYLFVGWVDLSA